MNKKKSYRQLKHISTQALLEESNHLRLATLAISSTAVLLIALIVWAGLTKITEIAITQGEIIPQGNVVAIQHLEGGRIVKILVEDGEEVHRGQIIAQLDPTSTKIELEKMMSLQASLLLDAERLESFLSNQKTPPNWQQRLKDAKYNLAKYEREVNNLIANQKSLLQLQQQKKESQRSVILAQIAQNEEKIKQLEEERKIMTKNVELLEEEFSMYRALFKTKGISRKDFLIILREVNKAKGEKMTLLGLEQQAKRELDESRNKLSEVENKLYETSLSELNEIHDQLLQIRHAAENLQSRLKNMDVFAPATGIIKDVQVSASQVIPPGGVLMDLVPMEKELEVQTRINTRDIGHINVGAPATIKVLTYDFTRYGSIKGVIKTISPSTSLDAEGNPYYKAIITLDQQYVGSSSHRHRLLPGMTVQADIITGDKSLLQYLLKPIHLSISSAFHER